VRQSACLPLAAQGKNMTAGVGRALAYAVSQGESRFSLCTCILADISMLIIVAPNACCAWHRNRQTTRLPTVQSLTVPADGDADMAFTEGLAAAIYGWGVDNIRAVLNQVQPAGRVFYQYCQFVQ
jgi:hypothetical protein